MSVYYKIQSILDEKHMSKRTLAEKANIPYTTIMSAFGRQSKSFSMENLQKIATALDVDVGYLLQLEICEEDEQDETLEKIGKAFPDAVVGETEDGIGIDLFGNSPINKGLPEDTVQAWEEGIVYRYRKMNDRGKEKLFEQADDMSKLPKYQK